MGGTSLDNGNGPCAACNQEELAGESASVVRDGNGKRRTGRWTTRHGRSATRGAVNLDPHGTYRRRRARDAARPREPEAQAPAGSAVGTGTRVLIGGGADPGTATLHRALTDLPLRLTDLPPPDELGRPGRHPGGWIVRRGPRGR